MIAKHWGLNTNLQRLSSPSERRQYDNSGMGPGFINNDDISGMIPLVPILFGPNDVCHNDVNYVNQLSMALFRKKLIENFDILFQQNKIRWPKSKGGNKRMPTPL